MRTITKLATLSLVLATTPLATADTIANGPTPNNAAVRVKLELTLTKAVTLRVRSADMIQDAIDPSAGTVNFGAVDTLSPAAPAVGAKIRVGGLGSPVPAADWGASFFSNLEANAEVTGGGQAALSHRRAAAPGPGDIPAQQLRIAPGALPPGSWAQPYGGAEVGNADAGLMNLQNGQWTPFQLAAYMKDSDTAGQYASTVTLTATAL